MSMTPDYGEPWKEKAYNYTVGDTGDVDGVIEIRTREELKVADVWNPSDEKEAFFSRAIACVNACAGMADPAAEIEAMREAIREAYLFITRIKRHELEKDFDDYVSSYGVSQAFAISENACTEILAKLKPFTTP